MRFSPTVLLLVLSACATAPDPVDRLGPARAALQRAVAAQAEEHSPIELRFARERLSAAEAAQAADDAERAARLGEQAQLTAELAVAKSEAAVARERLRQAERELDEVLQSIGEAQ